MVKLAARLRGIGCGRGGADQRGQAMVELALLLPILLLVVFGIVEFGFLFTSYLAVQQGAREGARFGAVNPGDDTAIGQRVLATVPQLDPSRLTVTVSPDPAQRRSGDPITIQVRYLYRVMVPLIAIITGDELTLETAVSMRIE